MSMTDPNTRDEAVQEIIESLRRPVMLHSNAAQTNAERQQAADTIATLSRQLAEAQAVIERQAKVLRIIEEMLLPAEQTSWLSGSGREIMRMVREVLSERDKHAAAMGTEK